MCPKVFIMCMFHQKTKNWLQLVDLKHFAVPYMCSNRLTLTIA